MPNRTRYSTLRIGVALSGCAIYVHWYPCVDCTIIHSGIIELIAYAPDQPNSNWAEDFAISGQMLKEADVNESLALDAARSYLATNTTRKRRQRLIDCEFASSSKTDPSSGSIAMIASSPPIRNQNRQLRSWLPTANS
jgi:hypothetical protein